MSADQVLSYIVPGSGSYGNADLRPAPLYLGADPVRDDRRWAAPSCCCSTANSRPTEPLPVRLTLLPVSAVALLALLALANVISTLAICGMGLCPQAPSGYLIFNDNLSLTLLGKTP